MILATGNVSAFALKAGVDRTMLYRAFTNNPGLDLVLKVITAADFKMIVVDHPKVRGRRSGFSERLSRAFETEEITLITNAFSQTLRAQGNVLAFTKKANLSRASLYRSFTAPRVPSLGTVLSFLNVLGLRLALRLGEADAAAVMMILNTLAHTWHHDCLKDGCASVHTDGAIHRNLTKRNNT